jgi:hypothetical protein
MNAYSNPINANMKLGDLIHILSDIVKELGCDSEVWLSCDEEGNEILPMPGTEELSLCVDRDTKTIILFPAHR